MINTSESLNQGIAIIGMAGRFPGANSVTQLWENLCNGVEALHHYSPEEIQASLAEWDYLSQRHMAPLLRSENWVPKGFRLDNVDKFDAGFFGYTPAEAELLDPQQRLFLECAWATFEDAGYIPDQYPGNVGVFAGATLSRYFVNNIYANRDIIFSSRDLTAGIGNEPDYIANRVAYKLNLKGPAISVQTACSTSLVAIHLACQCLHAGEADACLAGGVLVNLPGGGYLWQEGSMMSPDGHIRSFDASANGTVFSEGGVGAVLLKRYADAVGDGDHIYGVILGSAVSNDGNQKAGYTAPGVSGQIQVLDEALAVADIAPESIGYIETHGTGTPLGDPIEITALRQVWPDGDGNYRCALGSLKPNLGHLAPVAGVAGLLKATLAVKTGLIPPQINFQTPNPQLELDSSPFHISTELQKWNNGPFPRTAAVSSFGIGGTNGHVIIRQPPQTEREPEPRRPRLLRLSALSAEALRDQAKALLEHLHKRPDTQLRDIALTLRVGRKPLPLRHAFVATDTADFINKLETYTAGKESPTSSKPSGAGLVWMFSGQGSQYVNMGRGLRDSLPVFRDTLKQCFNILAPLLGQDPKQLIYPHHGTDEAALGEQLRQTRNAQPILFAFEYSMARQLLALGIEPAAMIGHSLGEFTAACLAEVFNLDVALRLVVERARLMQAMPPGAMLAVTVQADDLAALIDDDISLAADNAPGNCVLSGPTDKIEALAQRLEEDGLGCRLLITSHAFHSAMMEPVLPDFTELVRHAAPHPPKRPFISNVSGTWITDAQACDPEYWARHLRGTVRFAGGIRCLMKQGFAHFMELGPGNTLCRFANRSLAVSNLPGQAVELVHHAKEDHDDEAFFLGAMGRLWAGGAIESVPALEQEAQARRIPLPTYPFAHERHWVQPPQQPAAGEGAHYGRLPDPADWLYVPSWRQLGPLPPATRDWSQDSVLLLEDEQGLTQSLGEALERAGAHVLCMRPGSALETGSRSVVRIDQPEDYQAVLQELSLERPLTAIVHAWSYTDESHLDSNNWLSHLDHGYFSLLHLVQALAEAPLAQRVALLSVTTEATNLNDAPVNPAKAAIHGLHLCLGHEYLHIESRNLDLPVTQAGQPCPDYSSILLQELEHLLDTPTHLVSPQEKNLARRGRSRWGIDYVTSPQPERNGPGIHFRPEALYLITGGLGALGLSFAEWLANQGARRLALMGRSALPDAEHWDTIIDTADPDDAQARRLQRLRSLQDKGVEIHYLQVDVAAPDKLKQALASLQEHNSPVAGVLHCAGVADAGAMQLKTRDAALRVLSPKVAGMLALSEALADQKLDFFVLFSSLFSVIGGPGQAAYAAANSVLDAFARSGMGTQDSSPVSLNWSAWRGAGMAAFPSGNTGPKSLEHPFLFQQQEQKDGSFVFSAELRERDLWALREHRIGGQAVMPGTGLIEALRAAQALLSGNDNLALRDLTFHRPLFVPPQGAQLELRFRPQADGWYVSAHGGSPGALQLLLDASLYSLDTSTPETIDLQSLIATHDRGEINFGDDRDQFLQTDNDFLQLGPRWHCLRHVYLAEHSLVGELALASEHEADLDSYALHPALLDMATGPICGHLMQHMELPEGSEYLPFAYGAMRQFASLPRRLWTHLKQRDTATDGDVLEFDIRLYGSQGEPLVEIDGFTLMRVPTTAFKQPPTQAQAPNEAEDTISTEEGHEIFTRLLGHPEGTQWVITPVSLPGLLQQIKAAHNTPKQQRPNATRDADSLEPASTPTQETLVKIFEQALGVSPVGIHDNFFEMGGDSVLAIQIVSTAKAQGLPLKPADLFEHQNVHDLARLFEERSDTATANKTDADKTAAQEPDAPPTWMQSDEISQEDLQSILQQID